MKARAGDVLAALRESRGAAKRLRFVVKTCAYRVCVGEIRGRLVVVALASGDVPAGPQKREGPWAGGASLQR